MLFEQDLAAIEEHGGVDGGLAGIGRRGQGDPGDDSGGQIGGCSGQFFHGLAAAGEEAWLFKEVGGRIAADGEFGENGEASALICSAAAGRNDLFQIAGEIPDRGVDLGERDLHIFSLIQPDKRAAFERQPGGRNWAEG